MDLGNWASVFATLIAIVSAVISVHNSRLSVRPLLSVWQSTPHDQQHHHAITIKNCGNGPAIIESMNVFVDEQEVEGEGFDRFATAVCKLFALANGYTAARISYVAFAGEGQPFGANEEKDLIRFNIDQSFFEEGGDPINAMDRARLEIVYKDMFSTRWRVKVKKYKTEVEKLKAERSIMRRLRAIRSEF